MKNPLARWVAASAVLFALGLPACSSDEKVGAGRSPTPSVSASLGADAAFVPLRGYEYAPPPADQSAAVSRIIAADPVLRGAVTDVAIRVVMKGPTKSAEIDVMTLNASAVDDIPERGRVRARAAIRIAAVPARTEPRPSRIAGRDVFPFENTFGLHVVLWDQRSMLILVIGAEREEVEWIAALLIAAIG